MSHDAIDRAILRELQQHGRIANNELADLVSLSPSSCLRRTRALEQEGVISSYRAELDRNLVGLGLTVFISLKVAQHSRERSREIEAALIAIPAVVACHVVAGEADFLVEAVVSDLGMYEQILLGEILAIESISDARSSFAIRSALSRGPLPVTHLT
jgi:Lrp/AsnC family leucine-responsive transcriptional regulator